MGAVKRIHCDSLWVMYDIECEVTYFKPHVYPCNMVTYDNGPFRMCSNFKALLSVN